MRKRPVYIIVIKLVLIAVFFIIMLVHIVKIHTTPRPSAVRMEKISKFKQLGLALTQYKGDYGVLPGKLSLLAEGNYIDKESLKDYILHNFPYVIYQTYAFQEVNAGSAWGGPGEVTDKTIPPARAIWYVRDEDIKIIDEDEFQKLLDKNFIRGSGDYENKSEWVTSEDGEISLRFLSDKKIYNLDDDIKLMAELRNNSESSITLRSLAYSFGTYGNALDINVKLQYWGPHKDFYVPPVTVFAGSTVYETDELFGKYWKGLNTPGEYTITLRYGSHSSPGDKVKLWNGDLQASIKLVKE